MVARRPRVDRCATGASKTARGQRVYNAAFVASQPEPLLSIHGLACCAGRRVLFSGIDATLGPGDAIEVRGANGSGKTTLLRCAAGLLTPTAGAVRRTGDEPPLYLGHKPGMSSLLSPIENMRWHQALIGQQPSNTACGAALKAVGLHDERHDLCGQLSAGQQRRVGLARLIVSEARLWLLDEPFSALDAAGRALALKLIAAHRGAGGAVLCATHEGLNLPNAQVLQLP